MTRNVPKIIAIDGPAASGKGTLSRNLARRLNFAHMDTGALYRAVAYETIRTGLDPAIEGDALKGCERMAQDLKILENNALRTDDVAVGASKVAAFQSVRDRLVDIQRGFAHHPPEGSAGAVLDGRDIGTVICTDAGLKLYVTAELEIRAQRRMKELHSKGISVTYGAVLEDMRARDARDSGRQAAPLKPAEDAVMIDSSTLSEVEMLELALGYAIKAFGPVAIKRA
jgi:CMP/dCMP kinase